MTLAVIASLTLSGMAVEPVQVEVHVGGGLPGFALVGLADTEVRESRDRVRAALASSGYELPDGRITVNLSPADLPKASGRFDLPVALGVLLASGMMALAPPGSRRDARLAAAAWLGQHVFAAELSLTGALMPVRAALALALGVASRQPGAILVLPAADAEVAARVPGIVVLGATSLRDVIDHLTGVAPLSPVTCPAMTTTVTYPCLADVRGQQAARRALEIAAAGEHSLLMSGPPGSGKSMLAQRLPGLLPPLSPTAALESAALAGLAGDAGMVFGQRPYRAPHHSASRAALVGGGTRPRPGEISLAHHGVLFLDEVPEFARSALEALREPLETGEIAVVRALYRAVYPARFQLVAAMNPCPCGWQGHPHRRCRCSPDQVSRYQQRLSGPWLDRIDVQIDLPPTLPAELEGPPGESSAVVATRVLAARGRQQARQGTTNARLAVAELSVHCVMTDAARQLWQQSAERQGWSARVAHRVARVARTLADLEAVEILQPMHVAEAAQYRCRADR